MVKHRWTYSAAVVVATVTIGTLTGVSGAYATPLTTHVAPASPTTAAGDPTVAAFTLYVGEKVELGFLTEYGFPGARYRVADQTILPKGLKLNKHTGLISGKPRLPETVQLTTFEVLDPAGQVITTVTEFFIILPAP
jgi:hypothetical protein